MSGPPGEHNLALLAEKTLERLGDRETLFFEGRWFRSGELLQRARRLAAGLTRLGLARGDRVLVMTSNSPSVGVVYNALWRAGAVITPAIFLLSEQDVGKILADSEAVAIVTSPEFADKVRTAAGGVPSVRWFIATDPVEGMISLAELEAEEPAEIVPCADDDLAALMYTGGTTGRAKGVMLSHGNLWRSGRASTDAGHVPGVNRALVCLPLSHAFGLLVTVVGMHSREPGAAVLMPWFEPVRFLELIQEHRLQTAPVVPSMLQYLLAQPLEDYDLTSLRFFNSGAAPLAAEVIEEIRRRIPSVEIREGYGLTESSAIVSANPPGAARPGSVGLPVPGCEVRIVDGSGMEVPRGEVGEICVRSQTVMRGYWRAPELTAEAIRDGWLRTGDLGRLDRDGYLYISDRKKDLIIRGGFNVFPRDVEDALLEHPAVSMAAVVGRPDREVGEEVVAFVALRPGMAAASSELVDFGRRRLGGYKYPREVHIVESVPLTPVGKVDRKAVRLLLPSLDAGRPTG